MAKKIYRKKDCAPSHPGNILKSGFIEEYGLRIETVASLLGITRGHLSLIINGRNPVTPDHRTHASKRDFGVDARNGT